VQIADRVLIHVDTNLPARNLITNRMAYVTYLLLSGMLGSSRQDETILIDHVLTIPPVHALLRPESLCAATELSRSSHSSPAASTIA